MASSVDKTGSRRRSVADLFNNPALSDIKIRLVHGGSPVREWYAHKAILCLESDFFHKAFTAGFREASEGVLDVHDDDIEHFELMLKFIYDGNLKPSSESDTFDKQMLRAVKLWILADKYGMSALAERTTALVKTALYKAKSDCVVLEAALHEYYGSNPMSDTVMGKAITSCLNTFYRGYSSSEVFENMVETCNTFGADVALATKRANRFDQVTILCKALNCRWTNTVNIVRLREMGHINFHYQLCKVQLELP